MNLSSKNLIRFLCNHTFIIICLSLFAHNNSFAQDYQKMVDISEAINKVMAELDSCKNDLDCLQIVSQKLEKLTKELEQAQNTKPNQQSPNNQNPNTQIGGETNIPVPPTNLPPAELPAPFNSLTNLQLEHIVAANPKPDESADCELINATREKLLHEIAKIYDKEKRITAWQYPMTIYYCSKATVTIVEEGKIDIPPAMRLNYKFQSKESPSWIAAYELYLDETNSRLGRNLHFKMWSSQSAATLLDNYSGWIIDQSVYPPIKLDLDQASFLSEEGQDPVWNNGFYNKKDITYSYIQPLDYNSISKNSNYLLWLYREPVRFYPKGKPEYYIESPIGTIQKLLNNEEILNALKKGEYNAVYKDDDFTGTSSVTKNVTIKFEVNECDKKNSAGVGAIVLAGDCIDHGGEVIVGGSGILVNNKQVAFIGDKVICKEHGITKIIAAKKIDVISGEKQFARIGDKTECGATIIGGSKNTFAGIK